MDNHDVLPAILENDTERKQEKPLFQIPDNVSDYTKLLDANGIIYKQDDTVYLAVGEIRNAKGWIFHISVIKIQFLKLLETVLPFLMQNAIPFRIPVDEAAKDYLVDGTLGYEKLGKVLSIYVEDDSMALVWAKELIKLTMFFRGPEVPTDIHLGAVVYTRYGGFNTALVMNDKGYVENYMKDDQGGMVKDPYSIPFVLPAGVTWPFGEITKSVAPRAKRIFRGKYLPYIFIKPDVKGRVIKGINISKFWNPRWCLIKEGKMGMCSDEEGRDMIDRIQWQYELHNELSSVLPLPAIVDHFEAGHNSYLVMEFIEGSSLDVLQSLIFGGDSWFDLAIEQKLKVISYLQEIVSIIMRLHEHGYLHRDITAANFLIDKHNKIYLIDMELAWNYRRKWPSPAFRLGTPGCMSPEQSEAAIPTIAQDVYSIGILLLVSFVRLRPSSFDILDRTILLENLSHFIGDSMMALCIRDCLSIDPLQRPSLSAVKYALDQYSALLQTSFSTVSLTQSCCGGEQVREAIQTAIQGLSVSQMLTIDGYWSSLNSYEDQQVGNRRSDRTYYMGIREGISGPLYMLGWASRMGWELTACKSTMTRNWEFLNENFLLTSSLSSSGLYRGAAGAAICIHSLVKADLLPNDENSLGYIRYLLDQEITGVDLAHGAAGVGIALLQCRDLLDEDFIESRLRTCKQFVLDSQLADGSWISVPDKPGDKPTQVTGLSMGVAGIAWWLLEYAHRVNDNIALAAAVKALDWLKRQSVKEKEYRYWFKSVKEKEKIYTLDEGIYGIAFVFIKAYEYVGELQYKKIAEEALLRMASRPIDPDFAIIDGMAGWGEVYLEAHRVFKDDIWRSRAAWIAETFLHTMYRRDNGGYWLIDSPIQPNADLLKGSSGLIYYLMHYLYPDQLGFILLPQ